MGSYLGQNFLIDSKVRTYIAEHIQSMYSSLGCEALIEVGPGKGAITKLISDVSDNFFVIEKDVSLAGSLKLEVGSKIVIQGDVLEVDVEKMLESGIGNQKSGKKIDTRKTLVVGNLPYYITSPILRKFFADAGQQKFAGGLFMLQDEVGQKLRIDAKKKSYLRWIINYAYDVVYLKGVPAKCFKPAPKVKSCLVGLRTRNQESGIGWEKFIQFLELYASFSRKTLGSIEKIIEKHSVAGEIKAPLGHDKGSSSTHDKVIKLFTIPEELKKKRLEELNFDDITLIIK